MPLSPEYLHRTKPAVKKRLADFGIPLERMQSIANAADAHRSEATPDHPKSAGGYFAYCHGTAELRRVFCTEAGWDVYRKEGVEGVICHRRRAIALFQNVHYACQPSDPRPACKKGPATTEIARGPQQGAFPFYSDHQSEHANKDGYETWFFCVGCRTEELTAELSLPSCVSGGEFGEFVERIHVVDKNLLDVDFADDVDEEDEELEFEVPISKKE